MSAPPLSIPVEASDIGSTSSSGHEVPPQYYISTYPSLPLQTVQKSEETSTTSDIVSVYEAITAHCLEMYAVVPQSAKGDYQRMSLDATKAALDHLARLTGQDVQDTKRRR
jgi:hypothetical protein